MFNFRWAEWYNRNRECEKDCLLNWAGWPHVGHHWMPLQGVVKISLL